MFENDETKWHNEGAKAASEGGDRSKPWPIPFESDESYESRCKAYDQGYYHTTGQKDGAELSWTRSAPTTLFGESAATDATRDAAYRSGYDNGTEAWLQSDNSHVVSSGYGGSAYGSSGGTSTKSDSNESAVDWGLVVLSVVGVVAFILFAPLFVVLFVAPVLRRHNEREALFSEDNIQPLQPWVKVRESLHAQYTAAGVDLDSAPCDREYRRYEEEKAFFAKRRKETVGQAIGTELELRIQAALNRHAVVPGRTTYPVSGKDVAIAIAADAFWILLLVLWMRL